MLLDGHFLFTSLYIFAVRYIILLVKAKKLYAHEKQTSV